MSTVNGFQVGSETLKYNYESLDNYNTPNFSTSSSKTYAVGDYVMYNGKLYKCTTATTGGTWVSGSWTLAVLSDDVNNLNRQINAIAYYSKNLLPIEAKTTTAYSVERIYENGVLQSTGTATDGGGRNIAITPDFNLKAGTYTLSKQVISGPKRALFLVFTDDSTYETFSADSNSITFTITADRTAFLSGAYSINGVYDLVYKLQLELASAETAWEAPSESTAVDKIARLQLTHVKVMSYNVGSYNNGTSKDFTQEEQAEITKIYRQFYNDQGCDILGLQEAKTNFSTGNPVNPQIYNYLYPYIVDSTNTAALKSRFAFAESGTFDISTDTSDNRHCAYAICEIAGREVYILDTHFSPRSAELRQDNYAEVLAILAQHEYFICFGDFNCGEDATEYNAFINAGYNIANCGYLSVLNTMGSQIGTNTPRPNDNIVTSGNIIISGVKVLSDLYNTLKSDHLPIVADLIFNA